MGTAWNGGLAALAIVLLLAGCGDPEATYDRETVLPAALANLEAEIETLERECEPPAGTERGEVERRFGEGEPIDAKRVRYPFLPPRGGHTIPDGVLVVAYDGAGKVAEASFLNPYAVKGRPATVGGEVPVEELHAEAVQRVAQMKRIQAELERRADE